MAGSRLPGSWGETSLLGPVQDGTSALIATPLPGPVGMLASAATPAAAPAPALMIDTLGRVQHPRVKNAIASTIERGPLAQVRGLIVHQTGGATAQSSLDSYKNAGANGAHFLIDKDGTIYQTASVLKRTWHVGKLKARCLLQKTCTATELKAYSRFDPTGMNKRESAKAVPDRFPSNDDALGIELVGAAIPAAAGGEPTYETVTAAQNDALKWLVGELTKNLGVPMTEIFRHPDVSRKNPSEASTAQW
jgi:N-acetylmuramoyl-L-alanine amidase